jgi:transcriptional regulator with XRE-family HTH domain
LKTAERQRARELRAFGWSIKEIERSLGVSRSSVSLWVRDVSLTAEQRSRLISRIRLGPMISGERSAAAAREVRHTYQEEGRRFVHERGSSYLAGCMLYWAEGSKARNTLSITNSDPELLETFVRFVRTEFGVPDERFRVSCNLFADHAEDSTRSRCSG